MAGLNIATLITLKESYCQWIHARTALVRNTQDKEIQYDIYSEVPLAQKGCHIPIVKSKGNPWFDFLGVMITSGIAHRHARTMTMTGLRKVAVILQLIQNIFLTLDIRVIINWHLSKQSIYWPVPRDHIVVSVLELIISLTGPSWCLIGSGQMSD